MASSFIIKSHIPGMTYKQPHIYALNKGNNAGKPNREPYQNCFVILCDSEVSATLAYHTSEALWVAREFRKMLVGSVVPFIKIADFKAAVRPYLNDCAAGADRYIKGLSAATELELNLNKQIATLAQMRQALALQFLKSKS